MTCGYKTMADVRVEIFLLFLVKKSRWIGWFFVLSVIVLMLKKGIAAVLKPERKNNDK